MEIGERIKIRRKQLEMTQMDLAQESGMSVAAIQKIEAGQGSPSWSSLMGISRALKFHVNIADKEVDLDDLAYIGVPIYSKQTSVKLACYDELVETLQLAMVVRESFSTRVREALSSFIYALKSHFPVRYRQIKKKIKGLGLLEPKVLEGRIIKLSRIARFELSRYL